MPPFIQNILALPAKTKAILGVSFVAIIAIAFIMLKVATAPSYSLIASGLDPAQTGKITAALDAAGVGYKIGNGGTSIAVQQGALSQARVALATGQASDPTAVVMAVERAQLAMQLASQIRTKAVEAAQDIFHTQV